MAKMAVNTRPNFPAFGKSSPHIGFCVANGWLVKIHLMSLRPAYGHSPVDILEWLKAWVAWRSLILPIAFGTRVRVLFDQLLEMNYRR